MIDAATLQARLDAELQEHRAAGRAIYYGDRRLAAGVIKEHPDGRREEVAFDAKGRRAGSADPAAVSASPPDRSCRGSPSSLGPTGPASPRWRVRRALMARSSTRTTSRGHQPGGPGGGRGGGRARDAGPAATLIRGRRDVVHETTLAGTTALRVIDRAKAAGYTIEAVFVAVPSADLAIGRVAQRTAAGGRFVPPEDVRRRYERSFDNLPGLVARADVTTVYDNTEKNRTVVARVEGRNFTLRRLDATNDLHVRIAQAIKAGLSDRTDPARPSLGRRTAAHELPAGTMLLSRRVVTRARPWRPKPPEPRRRMFSPS